MAKDAAGLGEAELHSAMDLLRELAPGEALNRLQPSSPNTVYTTLVTLWMLTLQRLGCGKTLADVVRDVLSHNRELLPGNRRVEEGTLSLSSAAYSNARQRLAVETAEYFANRVSRSIIASSSPPGWCEDRRVFILDGTTITLEPTPELQQAFPPATNQHGETVWPVAMLLVAHEAETACALTPEIGAMYGANNTSEGRLAKAVARRLPRGSLVMADAGFGIFGVAHSVVHSGSPILLRMTKPRFRTVRRQATLIEELDGRRVYEACWTPSAKERKSHPELPADASLDVFLHEVPLENGETLCLVTTLPMPGEQAAEWYARRYDVEHDIRDIKVTLDTENIRARSVAMVKKELLTSMVAYNLVVQFRRQAAALANVPPRRLSFRNTLRTFESFLLSQPPSDAKTWAQRYEAALRLSAKHDKLPLRSKPRNPPRQAHPRRPKSTKFMKRQRIEEHPTEPTEKPK